MWSPRVQDESVAPQAHPVRAQPEAATSRILCSWLGPPRWLPRKPVRMLPKPQHLRHRAALPRVSERGHAGHRRRAGPQSGCQVCPVAIFPPAHLLRLSPTLPAGRAAGSPRRRVLRHLDVDGCIRVRMLCVLRCMPGGARSGQSGECGDAVAPEVCSGGVWDQEPGRPRN